MVLQYAVGVDENGLGAQLGPLVVSAAFAQGDARALRALNRKARGAARELLFDSKALVSYRDSSLGEAWARAMYPACNNVDELLAALMHRPLAELQAPCPRPPAAPASVLSQCFRNGEAFSAPAAQVDACGRAYARLLASGIAQIEIRSAIVCNQLLNQAKAQGISRFQANLNTMESLLLWAGARAGGALQAVCGKVGGYNVYPPAFGPLQGRVTAVLEEGRAQSVYTIAGVGKVAFVRDADASHQLVSLASLVGKWLRDHWMRRVIAHHQIRTPTAPSASGYHDKTTKQFVQDTAELRRLTQFPDACFARQ